MTDTPEILFTSEAAEFLKRPIETLRYWRKHGDGPPCYRRMGRFIYFRGELAEWLQGAGKDRRRVIARNGT